MFGLFKKKPVIDVQPQTGQPFQMPAATGLPGTPSVYSMEARWRNYRIQIPGVVGITGGWTYNSLGPAIAQGNIGGGDIR